MVGELHFPKEQMMRHRLLIAALLLLSVAWLYAEDSMYGAFKVITKPKGADITLYEPDIYLCATPSPVYPVFMDEYMELREGIPGRSITLMITKKGYVPLKKEIFVPFTYADLDEALADPSVFSFDLERDYPNAHWRICLYYSYFNRRPYPHYPEHRPHYQPWFPHHWHDHWNPDFPPPPPPPPGGGGHHPGGNGHPNGDHPDPGVNPGGNDNWGTYHPSTPAPGNSPVKPQAPAPELKPYQKEKPPVQLKAEPKPEKQKPAKADKPKVEKEKQKPAPENNTTNKTQDDDQKKLKKDKKK